MWYWLASEERRKCLKVKRLCYNYTSGNTGLPIATASKRAMQSCGRRHHTSICDQDKKSEKQLTAHQSSDPEVIYPVVVIDVDGVKCRALLDSGAGSSYASAMLLDQLRKKPAEAKFKKIEMLLGSATTRVEMFEMNISAVDGKFSMGRPLEESQYTTSNGTSHSSLRKSTEEVLPLERRKDDRPRRESRNFQCMWHWAPVSTQKSKRNVGRKLDHLGNQWLYVTTAFGWTIMSLGRETN